MHRFTSGGFSYGGEKSVSCRGKSWRKKSGQQDGEQPDAGVLQCARCLVSVTDKNGIVRFGYEKKRVSRLWRAKEWRAPNQRFKRSKRLRLGRDNLWAVRSPSSASCSARWFVVGARIFSVFVSIVASPTATLEGSRLSKNSAI